MNKNETIDERLKQLRNEMRRHGIDLYIVPACDFHGSEYIGDYFKSREFISGFTGSAGTVVVTMKEALLWTDGRYFIQAKRQLRGTEFFLMKSGEENVPSIKEYIERQQGIVVGFDGRTMTEQEAKQYQFANQVITDIDLIGNIWRNRPKISEEKVWILPQEYAGESCSDKLSHIREHMTLRGVDVLLMTALDEIAWTLNLRGNDVKFTPVFMSFMIISKEETILFSNKNAFDDTVMEYLEQNNVRPKDYGKIYEYVKTLKHQKIWLDTTTANHNLVNAIDYSNEILNQYTPAFSFKAVKNETEITNIKKAHLLDGIAMTRFLYWLKNSVGKIPLTELSLVDKLEEFRSMGKSYIEPSFEPIVGYQDHGAIVHYSATEETNYKIGDEGIVLIDSGGHYLEGTTDITRTISLGNVTQRMREIYTTVLRGHLHLAAAVFKEGCSGVALDYIAREPLWNKGLDYNHGTGHGVGYILNVHEGPNAFRYRILEQKNLNVPFQVGMVTSDEPGMYLEGEFGVRIENLILCKKIRKTDYGQFLGFEHLTLVPYDMELIDKGVLSPNELQLLYEYHNLVYRKISPYLEKKEKEWLKNYVNLF